MFYPEKGKKYVRIRKNHRNYQEEMMRKRRLRNGVIVVVLIAAIVITVILGLPQQLAMLAFGRFNGFSFHNPFASVKEEIVEEEPAVAETEEEEEEPVVEEEPEPTTLMFVGDVELSEYVQANYDESGIDGVVSKDLRSQLSEADLFVINNEFCISEQGTPADKQYRFRVAPGYVFALTDMGVDVAGLANNHSLDYGPDALLDTIRYLDDAGIVNTGAGNSMDEAAKLIIKEENGIKFGFLACTHIIPYTTWDVRNRQPGLFTCYDPTELVTRVEAAKDRCDFLFVLLHWGIESTTTLESYESDLGHSLIDAGADAIIGSHPHILQGIEYYSGKPIFYSLGNFIFNQEIPETVAVKVVANPLLADGNIKQGVSGLNYMLLPAYAEDATTKLASESEDTTKSEAVLDTLRDLSPNVEIAPDGSMTER